MAETANFPTQRSGCVNTQNGPQVTVNKQSIKYKKTFKGNGNMRKSDYGLQDTQSTDPDAFNIDNKGNVKTKKANNRKKGSSTTPLKSSVKQ